MDKSESTQLVKAAQAALVMPDYGIDVQRVLAMRAAVEEVIAKVLREGEHYGKIPGTDKKSLWQPGAEVLCQVFRMRPQPEEVTVIERDDFIFLKIRCKLYNSISGELMGEALGSANTREDKYVKQTSARICPKCEKPYIFKARRPPYGWFCWLDKGGCGAQFAEEDKHIIDQTGAINSNKVWGLHHTILSMAQKRAYVKATRNATGTSDIFTDEDVPSEDDDDHGQPGSKPSQPRTKPAQSSTPHPSTGPKAGITDAQKLYQALTKAHIGTEVDATLPETEQKKLSRKAQLDWVNGMLKDAGLPEVNGFLELPLQKCIELTLAAAAGKKPQGR